MKTKHDLPETHKRKTEDTKDEKWMLHLYVAGQTSKSIAAFNNLSVICKQQLKGKYHIQVIDLLKNPKLARANQILALPTLIRKLPQPVKKIIGDLSNTEHVLIGLDLKERNSY